jgi:transcriptional regulator with XRE-family HTH domain
VNGWDRVIAGVVVRRSELGLTQKGLALKAGVAERTVQNLEAGKRPQPLIRGKIEKALGWPPGEMDRIATAPDPAPEPSVPPDVLRVIRRNYPPERQAEVIEMLEAIEREQRGEAQAPPERDAG